MLTHFKAIEGIKMETWNKKIKGKMVGEKNEPTWRIYIPGSGKIWIQNNLKSQNICVQISFGSKLNLGKKKLGLKLFM